MNRYHLEHHLGEISTVPVGTRWIVFVFSLQLLVLGSTQICADDPTEAEEALFDAVDTRLRANKAKAPQPVDRALVAVGSLTYTKDFPCPRGSQDLRVTLLVNTALQKWDPNRPGLTADTAALHTVNLKPEVFETIEIILDGNGTMVEGIVKLVQFNNELRLNVAAMQPDGTNAAADIVNEGVLYHEYLHSEFFIDRAVSEIRRQLDSLCASNDFELIRDKLDSNNDVEHERIKPLHERYMENNESRGIDFTQLDLTAASTNPNGEFSFRIDSTKDLVLGSKVISYQSENIEFFNITGWDISADTLDYGGKLDTTTPGWVWVIIDPPEGVESNFVPVVFSNLCALGGDVNCNTADLDALYAVFNTNVPPTSSQYDLNSDNVVGVADLTEWLSLAATENGYDSPFLRGDTELDRDVDITDFNALAHHFDANGDGDLKNGPFWNEGNFDGDDDIDITDFNILAFNFSEFGYGESSAIPEPSSFVLCVFAIFTLSGFTLWHTAR